MNCTYCEDGPAIADHETRCPRCARHIGFPNVRAARRRQERRALAQRYRTASVDATERGCKEVFTEFCHQVNYAHAIVCRPLAVAHALLSSDNSLYTTFYKLVEAGTRRPEQNKFDRTRMTIDGVLFPHYHEEIHFAALSLTNSGVTSFGECSLVLQDDAIGHRATVFEENSFDFIMQQNIAVGAEIPPGHRATWRSRVRLAAVKLAHTLSHDTPTADFPGILLRDAHDSAKADFIEVHIFGPIHRTAVAHFRSPEPEGAVDRVIHNDLLRLKETDASSEGDVDS